MFATTLSPMPKKHLGNLKVGCQVDQRTLLPVPCGVTSETAVACIGQPLNGFMRKSNLCVTRYLHWPFARVGRRREQQQDIVTNRQHFGQQDQLKVGHLPLLDLDLHKHLPRDIPSRPLQPISFQPLFLRSSSGNPWGRILVLGIVLGIVQLTASEIRPSVVSRETPSLGTGFSAQLDALRSQLETPDVMAVLARARVLASGPVLERSASLAHMEELIAAPGRRTQDNRGKAASLRPIRPDCAEQFAIASHDRAVASIMLEELPLIAAAWRLTGDLLFQDYLQRQLREVVTWKPFQRPGWTLAARKDPRLPPEGDGVWLATGTLLQALSIMLDILPPKSLPDDLMAAVRQRMAEEIRLTWSDWTARVPWYVQTGKANTNQWVVPSSGMLIATAILGRDRFPDAWRLGIDSLTKSLAFAGDDGSLNEGHTYGMAWTSFSLFLARHYASQAGDDTFASAPFFKNFPAWMALYFQPGSNPVNAFDGFNAQRNRHIIADALGDLTCLSAVIDSAPFAATVLRESERFRQNFFGLLALGNLARAQAANSISPLPAAGLFQRSPMFIWRQSWEPDVSGLWVRGGDVKDYHTHYDRGHVNFIVSGTPILIESGTPGYNDKRKRPEYDSALGHNVLILDGDAFPPLESAPIDLVRHSPDGGELSIDLRRVYPALSEASRRVTWTANTLDVTDTISTRLPVKSGANGHSDVTPAWRWHFASAETPRIERVSPSRYHIKIPAGRIVFPAWTGPWDDPDIGKPEETDVFHSAEIILEINSSAPIKVEATTHPDHTLKFRRMANPHTTLVVTAGQPVGALTVNTSLRAAVPNEQRWLSHLDNDVLPYWLHASLPPQTPPNLVLQLRELYVLTVGLSRFPGEAPPAQLINRLIDRYSTLLDTFLDSRHGDWFSAENTAVLAFDKNTADQAWAIYLLAEIHARISNFALTNKNQNPGLSAVAQDALLRARATFARVDARAHDNEHGGYFISYQEFGDESRDHDAARKHAPTQLHVLLSLATLLRADPENTRARARLEELYKLVPRHVSPETGHLRWSLARDWLPTEFPRRIDNRTLYGQNAEAITYLIDAANALGRPPSELLPLFEAIATGLIRDGIGENGAVYFKGPMNGPSDEREVWWWPPVETVVALKRLYQLSGDDVYASVANRVNSWVFSHLISSSLRSRGHWRTVCAPDGRELPATTEPHEIQTGFHVIRGILAMCAEKEGPRHYNTLPRSPILQLAQTPQT